MTESDRSRPEESTGEPSGSMLSRYLEPSLVETVEALGRHADLLSTPITSHRKALGGLTVLLMRAVRVLMTHALAEQTSYNRLNVEALEHVVDKQARLELDSGERESIARLEQLERSVRRLERSLEELRRLLGFEPLELNYLGFTNRFRGTETQIRERQLRYLERFRGRADVLDLGCGRGEFLQLLKEHGVPARGVDIDGDMVAACRAKGLEVEQDDLIALLRRSPDGSYGGLFAAQVIEHLTLTQLLDLLDLCACKLASGGVVVLETLNPESLFVHYRWFWVDPTHRWLVHPELLRFCLEERGLRDVEIEFPPQPADGPVEFPLLGEGEEGGRLHEFDRASQYLNQVLYATPDYAAIARRP